MLNAIIFGPSRIYSLINKALQRPTTHWKRKRVCVYMRSCKCKPKVLSKAQKDVP